MTRWRSSTVVALLCVSVSGLAGARLGAERLPVRRYSTADGLSGDYVISIYRDARGFLWFSTRDGISRFDGTRFVSYGVADGLPHATVNGMIQTRAGEYWVATNGAGLSRLHPEGPIRFVTYALGDTIPNNRVNVVFEDRTGRLWAGSDDGLFVRAAGAAEGAFTRVAMPSRPDVAFDGVGRIREDAEGSLWFTGTVGLRRRLPDGRFVSYRLRPAHVLDPTSTVLFDRQQRLWVGTTRGLFVMEPEPAAGFAGEAEPLVRWIAHPSAPEPGLLPVSWYTATDGLPSPVITALLESADGRIWIGTNRGVATWSGTRLQVYRASTGLPESAIASFMEDEAGNLWIGTVSGVARLIRRGLITYDESDGLGDARVRTINQDPEGRLTVVTGEFDLNRFDGQRFTSVRVPVPPNAGCNWMSPCGHMDRSGGWWMVTTAGLEYWPAPARLADFRTKRPAISLDRTAGLPNGNVFTVFQDSQGRLWIATVPSGVSRWDPVRREVTSLGAGDGLPEGPGLKYRATAFVEDHAGRMWVGFEGAGVLRERGGRFEPLDEASGMPPIAVTALHVDAAGRLWIASSTHGLGRIDTPTADQVQVRWIDQAGGLSTNNVRTLASDTEGRLYAGTSLGVDRVDPVSGAIAHFTVREGLGSQFVQSAFRDRSGSLWFGTISGLSRLDAEAAVSAPPLPPPDVFISGLRIAGVARPVSELGEAAPASFTLPADRNQLEIDFFAFDFDSGAPMRYQYQLDGVDPDWSPPTEVRTVNYAQLSPGGYRFLVRAVRSDGAVSQAPAVVAFGVQPPFYVTWWFIGVVALALAGVATAAYRMRVAQLLRVERVRARIATDLHDDIGASLSQIAILAEVARQRLGRADLDPEAAAPLARIAETSRSLVDSMSDIVWAINPEVDTLSDLVHRMRRFVEDTFSSGEVDVVFTAPDDSVALRLGADIRREVFLILKESVTNIARHAGARAVRIHLSVERRSLRLEVIDDGRGFNPDEGSDGNGVASMRRRVAALGGHLTIDSGPGRGTRIVLELDPSGAQASRPGFYPRE